MRKSHIKDFYSVVTGTQKGSRAKLEKNAKNKNIHNSIWLCVLHKSLIKHTCLRGRASHIWGPGIWLSEVPPKQA